MTLWADILKAVPTSRLKLKFRLGKDDQIRTAYLNRFSQLGVAPERIDIHGSRTPGEHMALYGDVDIALDTYPYHGTTTTCEALWMGVPVISLIGEAHRSRVGWSLLRRIGLEFFAATTPQEYVNKACVLASQAESLNKIRTTLRSRMLSSPLCDAQGFAAQMEKAFREKWKQWCEDTKEVQ
jgi:predicted O-linked N-acetylglucosamine transferase (SPINDLY family)